jgi:hypothetical protein
MLDFTFKEERELALDVIIFISHVSSKWSIREQRKLCGEDINQGVKGNSTSNK